MAATGVRDGGDRKSLSRDVTVKLVDLGIPRDRASRAMQLADDFGYWLAACKLVGIEPQVQQLEGDAEDFIFSANIHRRYITKAQRTMIIAKRYPEPGKRGRGHRKSL
jgi:hypothetical protein